MSASRGHRRIESVRHFGSHPSLAAPLTLTDALPTLRGMADTTEVDCLDEKLSETVFHLCNSHIEN